MKALLFVAPGSRSNKPRHVSRRSGIVACFGLLIALLFCASTTAQPAARVFTADEVQSTFPASVYYLGKTAPVQYRNSAAVHLGEHGIFFAGLVDTSGYASNVQETYQMYLLLEQPTQLGTATLGAGAYGAGFVGDKAVVMDLGGHVVAETGTQSDDKLARPRPLQMVQTDGGVRLYLGRRYCDIKATSK